MKAEDLSTFTTRTLQRVEPAKVLWHYTDFTGLKGILESRAIRLGHPGYLNDPSEIRFAEELQERVFDSLEVGNADTYGALFEQYRHFDREERFYAPYMASFCERGDELELWRAYADDGHGVSLGFLISELRDAIEYQARQTYDDANVYVHRVVYDSDEQAEIITEIARFALSEFQRLQEDRAPVNSFKSVLAVLNSNLGFFYPFLKHPCYRNETENRLVLHGHDVKYADMEYTPRRGFLKPYVEFKIEGKSFPEFPLHTIRVGPAAEFDRARSSIGLLLETVNLGGHQIRIEPSDLPYRGDQ